MEWERLQQEEKRTGWKRAAAKELLRFTAKPVKEIIEESGIRNDDLFRRLFKDGEGMSAEEYRMKWSQWVKWWYFTYSTIYTTISEKQAREPVRMMNISTILNRLDGMFAEDRAVFIFVLDDCSFLILDD